MRAAVLSVLLTLLSACSGSSHRASSVSPAPTLTGAERTEAGVPGPLGPRAKSSKDVDPNYALGEDVFVTDHGFVPRTLVAKMDAKILFHNETSRTVSITFTNRTIKIGPIAPDEDAAFTPDATGSYAYALEGSPQTKAGIQVELYYEPGETSNP